MASHKYIGPDFLMRELGSELHLPLSVVKPIVTRIFLKILKHLMSGRTILIVGFGKFEVVYKKPRYIKKSVADGQTIFAPPRMSPKFTFSENAKELIANSLLGVSEKIHKRKTL